MLLQVGGVTAQGLGYLLGRWFNRLLNDRSDGLSSQPIQHKLGPWSIRPRDDATGLQIILRVGSEGAHMTPTWEKHGLNAATATTG